MKYNLSIRTKVEKRHFIALYAVNTIALSDKKSEQGRESPRGINSNFLNSLIRSRFYKRLQNTANAYTAYAVLYRRTN